MPEKPHGASAEELLEQPVRELIMIAGKDGVGKTSSLVSQAKLVEELQPESVFYVLDTENKFRSAMKSFGADAPRNISYFKCGSMNEVTAATELIMSDHKPGDWMAVESMSRIWERAQDLGYQAITGMAKVDYMEKRREARGQKQPPVTPSPDQLWSVVKGAHDSAFFDLLTQVDDLNVIVTTTVSKPPKPDAFIKESADRKAVRMEMGIDMGLEGAPRIPYYIETLLMLELKAGVVSCRVLRDNKSTLEVPRVEFEVPDKKSFGITFWSQCRQ